MRPEHPICSFIIPLLRYSESPSAVKLLFDYTIVDSYLAILTNSRLSELSELAQSAMDNGVSTVSSTC